MILNTKLSLGMPGFFRPCDHTSNPFDFEGIDNLPISFLDNQRLLCWQRIMGKLAT